MQTVAQFIEVLDTEKSKNDKIVDNNVLIILNAMRKINWSTFKYENYVEIEDYSRSDNKFRFNIYLDDSLFDDNSQNIKFYSIMKEFFYTPNIKTLFEDYGDDYDKILCPDISADENTKRHEIIDRLKDFGVKIYHDYKRSGTKINQIVINRNFDKLCFELDSEGIKNLSVDEGKDIKNLKDFKRYIFPNKAK